VHAAAIDPRPDAPASGSPAIIGHGAALSPATLAIGLEFGCAA
jgi:hypothetical protein